MQKPLPLCIRTAPLALHHATDSHLLVLAVQEQRRMKAQHEPYHWDDVHDTYMAWLDVPYERRKELEAWESSNIDRELAKR